MHALTQIGKKADSRTSKASFQTLAAHDFVVPTLLSFLPIKDALQLLYTNKQILLSRGKRDLKIDQFVYGFNFLTLDTPAGMARYVGWVENGELNKLGLLHIPTRTYTYRGVFLNGERHGWGSEQTDVCCYIGEFKTIAAMELATATSGQSTASNTRANGRTAKCAARENYPWCGILDPRIYRRSTPFRASGWTINGTALGLSPS